jgi:hypothetical protein
MKVMNGKEKQKLEMKLGLLPWMYYPAESIRNEYNWAFSF